MENHRSKDTCGTYKILLLQYVLPSISISIYIEQRRVDEYIHGRVSPQAQATKQYHHWTFKVDGLSFSPLPNLIQYHEVHDRHKSTNAPAPRTREY